MFFVKMVGFKDLKEMANGLRGVMNPPKHGCSLGSEPRPPAATLYPSDCSQPSGARCRFVQSVLHSTGLVKRKHHPSLPEIEIISIEHLPR